MDKKNPMQTEGFAFLEFSAKDPQFLQQMFTQFGFSANGQHKTKAITHYQQGDIHFLLNAEPSSQAALHAKTHGAGANAMGFKVKDADFALSRALHLGAKQHNSELPAIDAIGGSVIYFIDDKLTKKIHEQDFNMLPANTFPGVGLTFIDHLTHNVYQGNMDKWADFYIDLFNFFEIRSFDIKGAQTGLLSRAMSSPCGNIKIPLNESKDGKSQIEEFLEAYKGEGIQHIALSTNNIYTSVEALRTNGIDFLNVPPVYYDMIAQRINWHQEALERLQKNHILIDGGKTADKGLLLQIFTQNMLGPAFFEIIQRKGDEGFGEGNFQALFEAIERDQIARGVL